MAVTGQFLRNKNIDVTNVTDTILEKASPKYHFGNAKNFLVGKLPHILIVFLAVIVGFANLSEKITASNYFKDFIYVDPDSERQIAKSIDAFTPSIRADDESVAKSVSTVISPEGFASSVGSVETQITAREEPLPDNTNATVSYRVRNGDTMTKIGWKFNVKLATIKYINDLENLNTIRPGVLLKIPPKGYEVSAAAIAKKEQDKQRKIALKRSTVTRGTSVARAAADGSIYSGKFIVPITYKYISQYFTYRHPGIDYVASVGTPVMAAGSGTVVAISSGWSGGYGFVVLVNHGNGVVTRYAHLSGVNVSAGQRVEQGQIIARSGNSGRSTGPHLHFEKIINGRQTSPF